VVAAVGVAVRAAVEPLLGPVPATIAALAATTALTGALHEDGLADTVDGLWGGADPARRLAIMRDSRIGVYGALALVAVAGMRVALLAGVDLAGFARALACAAVLGRAAWLPLTAVLRPAAPGLGAELDGPPPAAASAVAAALVAATLVAAVGRWAPVPLAAGGIALLGAARLLRRRLGGFTGDALGFVEQVVELAALAAVVALARAGLA
jgi:adenosylcobinamide-GDP ribazoletransferase